ncbi:uncharacterized mitochondrial protein AtMg00810-like [Dioscorea cayenensis subsp. rotundata]|uniref:Uncharacterized mitochondrial protein AtMg00810-like n=1 Tax=Dioscorea cayennensis subsp. rotundata TaxID=55577 RepID=A0AB40D1R6_DIOCR|nr:uncharacterized mitochondrial protein AtMg00810-like [Dioscorea cayenensis subsp. rotundata]
MKQHKEGKAILACVYVDDIIYTSSSKEMMIEFKRDMMKTYEMTDLGKLHYFLGLEVKQDDEGIFVSQAEYLEDLLKQCNMNGCRSEPTPMVYNLKLQVKDDSGHTDGRQYRTLIGKLMYLTRPA